MYEKVKRFFDLGLYTPEHVKQFVARGKLTPEEYEAITGQPWPEDPEV
ncbi:MAG: XkdX family protein [Clostridiales bacterium]|nr:XkdX family protein [Clostridiales bacterium]MCI6433935.1 XkdX family protein [Clostridiales bacterium]